MIGTKKRNIPSSSTDNCNDDINYNDDDERNNEKVLRDLKTLCGGRRRLFICLVQ